MKWKRKYIFWLPAIHLAPLYTLLTRHTFKSKTFLLPIFSLMKFNIKTEFNTLEIDVSDLVSTIIDIQSRIDSGRKIKAEWEIKQATRDFNDRILRSNIKIKVKKYADSLNYTKVNAKLLEGKNGIYLVFSVPEGSKIKKYDFFLMKKASYTYERKYLLLGSYDVVLDDEALRAEDMARILNNGVKHYTIVSAFSINMKIVAICTVIAGFCIFGITNAFAFFF